MHFYVIYSYEGKDTFSNSKIFLINVNVEN